ncbi:hypothetical protein SODG_003758 [Sodalis praecaptivus]
MCSGLSVSFSDSQLQKFCSSKSNRIGICRFEIGKSRSPFQGSAQNLCVTIGNLQTLGKHPESRICSNYKRWWNSTFGYNLSTPKRASAKYDQLEGRISNPTLARICSPLITLNSSRALELNFLSLRYFPPILVETPQVVQCSPRPLICGWSMAKCR